MIGPRADSTGPGMLSNNRPSNNGRSTEVGSLKPGKFADLLVLECDPRVDIKNTLSLSARDEERPSYDGETLDEVWPRQRKFAAAAVRGRPAGRQPCSLM